MYELLANVVDVCHLLIIIFLAFGGAIPFQVSWKLRVAHTATIVIMMVCFPIFGGDCWMTNLSFWLREQADPSLELSGSFAQFYGNKIGISAEVLVMSKLTISAISFFVGIYLDERMLRRKWKREQERHE